MKRQERRRMIRTTVSELANIEVRCQACGSDLPEEGYDKTGQLEARKVCFRGRWMVRDPEISFRSEWIWVLVGGPDARSGKLAHDSLFIFPPLQQGDSVDFDRGPDGHWYAVSPVMGDPFPPPEIFV